MNYYFKLEILNCYSAPSGFIDARISEIEFYSGMTKIPASSLSVVLASQTYSGWGSSYLLDENTAKATNFWGQGIGYVVIKSTQPFDNVKVYSGFTGADAPGAVRLYNYRSSVDPTLNDNGWTLQVDTVYPGAPNLQLHKMPFVINRYLFKTQDDHYWSHKTGEWIDLGIPVNQSGLSSLFQNYGEETSPDYLSAAKLGTSLQLCLWTNDTTLESILARYTAVPFSKLILPNRDISLNYIRYINSVSIASAESGNGKVHIIVSTDLGKTWYTWNDVSAWSVIDIANLDNVAANGMTRTVIAARSKSDWTSLVNNSQTIRFGYYLEGLANTDIANTDALTLNVDMNGKWRQAKDADCDVDYISNLTVDVLLYSSGDYKINY